MPIFSLTWPAKLVVSESQGEGGILQNNYTMNCERLLGTVKEGAEVGVEVGVVVEVEVGLQRDF